MTIVWNKKVRVLKVTKDMNIYGLKRDDIIHTYTGKCPYKGETGACHFCCGEGDSPFFPIWKIEGNRTSSLDGVRLYYERMYGSRKVGQFCCGFGGVIHARWAKGGK